MKGAVSGQDVYVLEYTNANGLKTEGWRARVRKIAADHTVTTLAAFPRHCLHRRRNTESNEIATRLTGEPTINSEIPI